MKFDLVSKETNIPVVHTLFTNNYKGNTSYFRTIKFLTKEILDTILIFMILPAAFGFSMTYYPSGASNLSFANTTEKFTSSWQVAWLGLGQRSILVMMDL